MRTQSMTVLRFLAIGMLILALGVALGCGSKEKAEPQSAATDAPATTAKKAVDAAKEAAGDIATLANPKEGIDPVCGMKLDEHRLVIEVDGKKYGFCSAACAEEFQANPEKYLTADAGHEGHDH